MDLAFTKMQGCANDYIYLDCRAAGLPQQIEALARKWSARHFSIGADGIVCICAPRRRGPRLSCAFTTPTAAKAKCAATASAAWPSGCAPTTPPAPPGTNC